MKLPYLLGSLLGGLVLAGSTLAAQPATVKTHAYFNGVKVAIDPKTGRLRQPTAAEMRALSSAMPVRQPSLAPKAPADEAAARKTQRVNADGRGVSMRVPESLMSDLTAVRTANGRLSVKHVQPVRSAKSGGGK